MVVPDSVPEAPMPLHEVVVHTVQSCSLELFPLLHVLQVVPNGYDGRPIRHGRWVGGTGATVAKRPRTKIAADLRPRTKIAAAAVAATVAAAVAAAVAVAAAAAQRRRFRLLQKITASSQKFRGRFAKIR